MAVSALALGLIVGGPVNGQPPLPTEEATVADTVAGRRDLFLVDNFSWATARIHAFSLPRLDYDGQITTGMSPQLALSPDRSTLAVVATYYSRGVRGNRTDVLEMWDTKSLTLRFETELPPKRAILAPFSDLLVYDRDGRRLFVQAATPAVSVLVVDPATGRLLAEVPTPGCWGIYPGYGTASRFSTLCGDGTMMSYDLGADGRAERISTSDPFFDPETAPLFVNGTRRGDLAHFVAYNGRVVTVDLAAPKPVRVADWTFVDGLDGGWRPGGYQVSAYAAKADVLYVLMHPDGKEGSHKASGTEIWALRPSEKRVLSRTPVTPVGALAVDEGSPPAIYAVEAEKENIARYDARPDEGYTLVRKDRERQTGWISHLEIGR